MSKIVDCLDFVAESLPLILNNLQFVHYLGLITQSSVDVIIMAL